MIIPMTLDPAHETRPQDAPTCNFCGRKFDLGYNYTCHVCGATYCYIHMSKHSRAHRQQRPSDQSTSAKRSLVGADQASDSRIFTSDPEEIELIRIYLMRLFERDDGAEPGMLD